jgi:hypothetical protein
VTERGTAAEAAPGSTELVPTGCRARVMDRVRDHDRAYYWLMRAKRATWTLPGRNRRARLQTAGHLDSDRAVIVDISGPIGLGGILSWAGHILEFAAEHDRPVGLRFSSPTYRPTWPVEDWLECYFARSVPLPDDAVVVGVQTMPLGPLPLSIATGDRMVWQYLSIRPECVVGATDIPFRRFASVHYRGSDKYLESPRQTYAAVLGRVESEMAADGLDKLFVASDEDAFVQAAKVRFGESCWSLPLAAVSDGRRPPHFSDLPGQIKAAEALTTMVLLARSELCVRTDSALSAWAMTLPGSRRTVLVGPSENMKEGATC